MHAKMRPMALGDEYMEVAQSLGPFSDRFLLTGAGFARPWDGYLAAEFWGLVLGDPTLRDRPNVQSLLHRTMGFEDAIAEMEITDRASYSDADRASLREAVRRAFQLHDANLCSNGTDGPGLLNRFVERFAGNTRTACLFTLNQDLMLERLVTTGDAPRVVVPCVHRQGWWLGGQSSSPWLNRIPNLKTPISFTKEEFARQVSGRLSLIKLHGSVDWSHENEEVLVIGGGKEESIRRFPILSMSYALFRAALGAGDGVAVMVIGYGFLDAHINQIIAHAVEASGLRLWVVDPTPAPDLKKRLEEGGWAAIWQGIRGHTTRPLKEALREGTSEWTRIITGFFDR